MEHTVNFFYLTPWQKKMKMRKRKKIALDQISCEARLQVMRRLQIACFITHKIQPLMAWGPQPQAYQDASVRPFQRPHSFLASGTVKLMIPQQRTSLYCWLQGMFQGSSEPSCPPPQPSVLSEIRQTQLLSRELLLKLFLPRYFHPSIITHITQDHNCQLNYLYRL